VLRSHVESVRGRRKRPARPAAQGGREVTEKYRFFGLSEALSWLAQFEGQGFEDLSALANLVLLQEMMLGLS